MNDFDVKKLWQDYEAKLEEARVLNLQSWILNLQVYTDLQSGKAESRLHKLAAFKTRAVVIGWIWILILGALIYSNHFRNLFFTVSVGAIWIITIGMVAFYIRHIILIRQLDYSKPVAELQQKLTGLQISTLGATRFAWLQLPFYTTWYWNSHWIISGDPYFWFIAFPIALLFCWLSWILYRNIRLERMDRKWVRIFMSMGPEYKSVLAARAFLDEIEAFRKGDTVNSLRQNPVGC